MIYILKCFPYSSIFANIILAYAFPISDLFILFCCIVTAIATVVTVAEILKNNGLAVEKSEIPIPCLLF